MIEIFTVTKCDFWRDLQNKHKGFKKTAEPPSIQINN